MLHNACDLRCGRTLQHEVETGGQVTVIALSGLIHSRYVAGALSPLSRWRGQFDAAESVETAPPRSDVRMRVRVRDMCGPCASRAEPVYRTHLGFRTAHSARVSTTTQGESVANATGVPCWVAFTGQPSMWLWLVMPRLFDLASGPSASTSSSPLTAGLHPSTVCQ